MWKNRKPGGPVRFDVFFLTPFMPGGDMKTLGRRAWLDEDVVRKKKEKSQPRRHDATDPTHPWALRDPQTVAS